MVETKISALERGDLFQCVDDLRVGTVTGPNLTRGERTVQFQGVAYRTYLGGGTKVRKIDIHEMAKEMERLSARGNLSRRMLLALAASLGLETVTLSPRVLKQAEEGYIASYEEEEDGSITLGFNYGP